MTLRTDYRRIIRAGTVAFWRNKLVSASSLLIMTVTLLVAGALLLLNALLNFSMAQIQDRVDVNVYFYPDVSEESILSLQQKLESVPEIAQVTYVSRDEAVAAFEERHEDDFLTLQALRELDDNPLGASLSIKAVDASQYEAIAQLFDEDSTLLADAATLIEKVNFYQNKQIIDRLNQIIDTVHTMGIAITVLLAIISVIITLNTIRLTIYTAREEIGVMRLVGAEGRYVRGPFIVAGVLYGVIAAIIATIILYPTTLWIGHRSETFFGGLDIFNYYTGNIIQFFVILVVIGTALGVIASTVAVHKYLKK